MKLVSTVVPLSLALGALGKKAVLGVPPEKQQLYVPDGQNQWACLNHPDIKIPFDRVNDDYCDCPDGSDEPGTAACPKGWFYCANEGHISRWIPSSRVNDGVCDYDTCCDGSDETNNEFVSCPNKCKEIHAEYKKKKQHDADVLAEGLKAKQKLLHHAADVKDNVQKQIIEKDRKMAQLSKDLKAREEELEQAITKDREDKLARGISADQLDMPSEIAVAVGQLKGLKDKRRASLEQVKKLKGQYDELKGIVERLKTGYNPNFNDPAVKEALRGYDDLKGRELVMGGVKSSSDDMDNIIQSLEAYRPANSGESSSDSIVPGVVQQKLNKLRDWGVQNGLLAAPKVRKSSNTAESETIQVARNRVEKAREELENMQKEVDELMADVQRDYGEDDALRGLKDECVKSRVGEYDYEVCWFGSASQNGNGHNVNLGQFQDFKVDKDQGVIEFNYDHGSRCWNGPIRKSHVKMECGAENKILTVSEPEKCEYHFKIVGPAACTPQSAAEGDNIEHSEL